MSVSVESGIIDSSFSYHACHFLPKQVGCGHGDGTNLAAHYLSPNAFMVGTDISKEMIAMAKQRFQLPQVTVMKL